MLAGCFDQVVSVVLEVRRRDAAPVRELQRGVVRHDLGNAMLLQFALEPDDELIRRERVQLHPSLPQEMDLFVVRSVQPERVDIAVPDVGRGLGLQVVRIDVGEPEADVDHPRSFLNVYLRVALQRPTIESPTVEVVEHQQRQIELGAEMIDQAPGRVLDRPLVDMIARS